jgi:hypothetical protein
MWETLAAINNYHVGMVEVAPIKIVIFGMVYGIAFSMLNIYNEF